MKLAVLMEGLEYTVLQGTADEDVKALVYFSDEAVPGSMFFAVPGTEDYGLDYAQEAVRRGAGVIAAEPSQEAWQNRQLAGFLPPDVTLILVSDVRKAMAHASCIFYGNPCRDLLTVGITGTKGKTSTAFMMRAILEEAGIPTGLIGTVKNGWEGHFEEADRTTPQSPDIHRWCRKMAEGGCRAVVMEISSQGLKQSRIDGVLCDAAIFTNLTPDHIGPGEHENFEEYAWWKSRLFSRCQKAVLNRDDPEWQKMLPEGNLQEAVTFGTDPGADYICENLQIKRIEGRPGVEFTMEGHRISMKLPGAFNAINGAAAAAAARELGISWEIIVSALEKVKIPGRAEPVDTVRHTSVLVDYAHNGVSLRQILTNLRQYEPSRLIVVFGCGGNRDRNRRFEMGRAAAELADLTVVTSDNPRKEKPEDIIADITGAMEAAGAGRDSYVIIADRREAIRRAVAEGKKDDIVLIAGKGHETYQIAGDKKIHFDDREIVKEAGLIMGE